MTLKNLTYLFRTLSLLFLVLAMGACSSDDTDAPDGPGPSAKFTLTPQTVNAEAISEPIKITVTTAADVEWSVDKPFKNWVTAVQSTTKGSGTITLEFNDNLDKNPRQIDLIVRCKGIDDPFYINIEQADGSNTAPTKPSGKLPAADATDVNPFTIFSWNVSTDENGDRIKYTVSYSKDQTEWITSDQVDGAMYTAKTKLDVSVKYYWYVTAIDARGLETKGDILSFTTDNVTIYTDREWAYYQNSENGAIPLIFTGDGFIESDYVKGTGDFDKKIDEGIEHFFSCEPFKTYRDKFKIIKLAAYSKEQGVTIRDEGDGSGEPYTNVVDTRFKVYYTGNGYNQTQMRLGNNYWDNDTYITKAFVFVKESIPELFSTEAGNEVFNNTTVIIVANHWLYGGTCWWPYTGNNTGRTLSLVPACEKGHAIPWCYNWEVPFSYSGTMRHEAGGHGFGRLADEYNGYDRPANSQDIANIKDLAAHGFHGNLDVTSDKTQVKWSSFFDQSGTPIANYEKVGVFNSRQYHSGVYMSEDRNRSNCMDNMENPFSAVSREFIVQKIFKATGEEYTFQKFLEKDIIPPGAQSVSSSENIPMMRQMPHASPQVIR